MLMLKNDVKNCALHSRIALKVYFESTITSIYTKIEVVTESKWKVGITQHTNSKVDWNNLLIESFCFRKPHNPHSFEYKITIVALATTYDSYPAIKNYIEL